MNRRITKSLAEIAATELRHKVYDEKLDKARDVINTAIESLVHKYIPAPILALASEFGDYLCAANHASVKAYGVNNYPLSPISGSISIKVPHACEVINVDLDDYKKVSKLREHFQKIYNESQEFKSDVMQALLSLRTEEKIKNELPEAIPFIKFPEKFDPPARVYTDLRKIIGGIKV